MKEEMTTDAQGQTALMLCECMAHVLIEHHVLDKADVIAAIEEVIEVKREMAGREESAATAQASIGLLRSIAQSLAAIDSD